MGAGVAGLAAAYRLRQAGYRVSVFEAGDRVGGRATTVSRDGFSYDPGGSILTRNYTSLLGLAKDAGLESEIIRAGSVIGFWRDGTVHYLDADHPVRSGLAFSGFSAREKLHLAKLGADVLRCRGRLEANDLAGLGPVDRESAADYAARRLTPELAELIVDATARGVLGVSAGEISSVDFLFMLVRWIGARFFVLRQGIGHYAETLAQHLDVHLSTPVLSVDERNDRVVLRWADPTGSEQGGDFAGCVLAVPAPVAGRLHSGLDPERAAFLRDLPYSRTITVTVARSSLSGVPPAAYVLVPRSAHPGVMLIGFPHNVAPGWAPPGKSLMQVYLTSDWAAELTALDDEQIVEAALSAADQVVPGLSSATEWAAVNRWTPFVAARPPGYTRTLLAFERAAEGDGRVQFAGDYFAVSSLEAASASGERAARRLRPMPGPAGDVLN